MSQNTLSSIIDTNQYQVIMMESRCTLPIPFASHPWFIINKKGVIDRWEVLITQHNVPTAWGHLHKNFLPPSIGLNIFPCNMNYRWESNIIGYISGGENSIPHKMIDLIESSPKKYLHNYNYNLIPGPNSNSYVQWIIKQFPECNIQLPWNGFGKKFFS